MLCIKYVHTFKLTVSRFIAPTVIFRYQAYSVNEYDGPAVLTLILSNPSSTTVTIEIFSTDGSATGNHVLFSIIIFLDN